MSENLLYTHSLASSAGPGLLAFSHGGHVTCLDARPTDRIDELLVPEHSTLHRCAPTSPPIITHQCITLYATTTDSSDLHRGWVKWVARFNRVLMSAVVRRGFSRCRRRHRARERSINEGDYFASFHWRSPSPSIDCNRLINSRILAYAFCSL